MRHAVRRLTQRDVHLACRVLALLLAIQLCLAADLAGQAVAGRVVLPDSATPATGVTVVVRPLAGGDERRTRTTASGRYVVPLSVPGRYALRALRLGFQATEIGDVVVQGKDTVVRNIVLSTEAIVLPALVVDGESCKADPRVSGPVLEVWEQARLGLQAGSELQSSGDYVATARLVTGHADAVVYYERDGAPNESFDSSSIRRMTFPGLLGGPDSIVRTLGYVYASRDAAVTYEVPSTETLGSDDFLARHCFRVAKAPPEHPTWLGIAFVPKERRVPVPGISGVLWLDRTSAAIRRVDFAYVSLPKFDLVLCDSVPPSSGPRGRESRLPACNRESGPGSRLGLGGSVAFEQTSAGAAFPIRWSIRASPDSAKYRRAGKSRWESGRWVSCVSGPDCEQVWWFWPRLVTETYTVTRVVRGGVILYANDERDDRA